MTNEGEFFLSVTGSIESGEFYEIGNAYCKYSYHFGSEWSIVAVRLLVLFFVLTRRV